jgi:3-oxoacyl-[acyl-carrier protein] reductase
MKKTALITGASGGIGRAIALKMADSGWNIILHYSRNQKAALQAAEAIRNTGQEAILVQADLMDRKEVQRVIAASRSATALIFAAGMSQYSMLQDVSDEDIL